MCRVSYCLHTHLSYRGVIPYLSTLGLNVPRREEVIMSSSKLINISAYCSPEEYAHLNIRRTKYTDDTGRKISISRFVIEQPDRQQSELAALKQVHALNVAILDLYRHVNTIQPTISGSPPPSDKSRKTDQRLSELVEDGLRASSQQWEKRNKDGKRKYDSDGNLLILDENTGEWKVQSKPNPHVALLAEIKERFKKQN